MSQYDDKINRGTLWTDDKRGNPKRPDMTGNLNVDGKKWRVSAWSHEGSRGPYLSLKVEAPWDAPAKSAQSAPVRQAAPAQRVTEAEPFNDDIPF